MWNRPTQDVLAILPKLYETEDVPLEEKVVHMHFFIGGCDWYAAEFDGEDLFWGFVILNGDFLNAEWGYFSLGELESVKVKGVFEIDTDLHWKPRKACEVDRIRLASGWKGVEACTSS